jgi:hypothetical protein
VVEALVETISLPDEIPLLQMDVLFIRVEMVEVVGALRL